MSDLAAQSSWLHNLLGVRLAGPAKPKPTQPKPAPSKPAARAVPVNPAIAPPPLTASTLLARPRSGAPIAATDVQGEPRQFKGAHNRSLAITQGPDGRVALAAPPPPIAEITFAGGGGKGAALPGAVRALHESGAIKNVKVVTGASVGSLTGALVAAGATADEFTTIANDPNLAPTITDGRNPLAAILTGGLTGEGLETLMRATLDGLLRKRITEYLEQTRTAQQQPDPSVLAVLDRLADGKTGPTFMDYRTLSKVIPAIKEMVISGSMMAIIDPATGEPEPDGRPQLTIFSADTEPDMEVALAVHASAALPPVFKPVDIKLSSGITARFQDGGVLNNVPSTDSLDTDRDLDPIPTMSSLQFVFEQDANAIGNGPLKGLVPPEKSAFADWITKAPNSAANMETYLDLAEKPEDVVVVPLHFTVPNKKGGKGKTKEFTGLLNGTTNFDMSMDDRLTLQDLTDKATAAHLAQRQAPQTRTYASMGQMLMCVSADDLAALVADGLEGAADAQAFRASALSAIAALARLAQAQQSPDLADPALQAALTTLDALPGADTDRLGFIARELNRGNLDSIVAAARKAGRGGALGAGAIVAASLDAKSHAVTILRSLVYPQLVAHDPKSINGTFLSQITARLRAAIDPDDVNTALHLAIDHFSHARDLLGRHGYKKFAAALNASLMQTA